MKPATFLLGLLAASHEVSAVADKWTPEGFNWTTITPKFGCATQNVTARPHTKELALYAADLNVTETDLVTHQAFPIAIGIGVALRAVTWLGNAAGIVSTALGCYELIKATAKGEQTTPESKTSCAIGAAGSVIGFGAAGGAKYFAKKKAAAALARATPPRLPIPELGQDFRQAIELTRFTGSSKRGETHAWKRGLEGRGISTDHHWDQFFHNEFTANMIRDANLGDGHFLGYADEAHQLNRRDGVHPLAPRFKFDHPERGPMVLSTMSSNSTLHITVEPWIEDNPSVHKRWQEEYRKEILENKRMVEGRFDHEAANADPGEINVDATQTFKVAEDSMHCYLGGDGWPLDQVMDVQLYDHTNKGTFGYASVGIFGEEHQADLQGLQPQPPVSGGDSAAGANC